MVALSVNLTIKGFLTKLKEQHAGPAVREYDAELRRRLGPNVAGVE